MKEDGDDPVDMEDVDVTPSKLKRKTYEREQALAFRGDARPGCSCRPPGGSRSDGHSAASSLSWSGWVRAGRWPGV
jgi:hypothetical protein